MTAGKRQVEPLTGDKVLPKILHVSRHSAPPHGASADFDRLTRLPVPRFPGGSMLRWPVLVAALFLLTLRDRLWRPPTTRKPAASSLARKPL